MGNDQKYVKYKEIQDVIKIASINKRNTLGNSSTAKRIRESYQKEISDNKKKLEKVTEPGFEERYRNEGLK